MICEGCSSPRATLQCPTCKKLHLEPSFFCSQDCFGKSWGKHKGKHTDSPKATRMTMSKDDLAKFDFTGSLRPLMITPKRYVPENIVKPDYATSPDGSSLCEELEKKNFIPKWKDKELEAIRHVCSLSRDVLDIACRAAKPGVTTDEIDRVVHDATIDLGMYPSPLGYYGFPKSVCTSVNEVICHGIPDSRPMEEGDIVNFDVSCFLDEFHGDLNETIFIGRPSKENVRLVHGTYECLQAGMNAAKPRTLYRHIGKAIEDCADKWKLSVVRSYTGHGVHRLFHASPSVPHYRNNKSPGLIQPGNVFTIEPMINLGSFDDVLWPDNWTSATKDGKCSAQFEHTFLSTEKGLEILTDWRDHIPTYQKQLKDWGIDLPTPSDL